MIWGKTYTEKKKFGFLKLEVFVFVLQKVWVFTTHRWRQIQRRRRRRGKENKKEKKQEEERIEGEEWKKK